MTMMIHVARRPQGRECSFVLKSSPIHPRLSINGSSHRAEETARNVFDFISEMTHAKDRVVRISKERNWPRRHP